MDIINLMIKLNTIKPSKNLILLVTAVVGILIIVATVFLTQIPSEKKTSEILSAEKVNTLAQKTLNFINENLLTPGTTASVTETSEEYGLIKMKLNIAGNEFDSYVTKDGKLLFPEAIKLEEEKASESEEPTTEKKSCDEIKKVGKPELQAFVVSKCPYGLQMQRILLEVVKNIPSLKENIKVRYLGSISNGKITSMHGDAEAQENLRQICIREETNKYWDYITCHIKKGDVDSCLSAAGINKNELNSCMTDSSKGLKYAKEDFDLQDKYNASGSPTLILNEDLVDEFGFGGRTAEALKTLLCCGFNEKPGFCSQKLTTDQAATSFSETYSKPGSTPSSGGCQ